LHVGQPQNLVDGMMATVINQMHHQVIVGNSETTKKAQAGSNPVDRGFLPE
jgi:hypothetical protein